MSITSPIPVLQGDKGTELRSQGEALLLRRPDDELRIPLTAIGWVHTEGRAVVVGLTAPAGVEPTAYRIEDVSRAAATAFADAVNEALPERAPEEEVVDGSTLVTVRSVRPADEKEDEEEEENGGSRRFRWMSLGVGVMLVAFSVVVGIVGEHVGRAVAVLLLGGLGALFLAMVGSALLTAWENWYLPRHGITVDAQQVWLDGRDRHVYTDTSGKTHPFSGSSRDETVRVAYSVRRPSRAVSCEGWGRQVKDLLLVVFLLAFAAPVVYGTVLLALPAFDG
ncbi:hypothetical protein ACFYV5_20015 [Streptomyces sp. NPDC003035]|uniref:hypothetical protein n=1 Tax=Streptomyces sp. NPDC003035 TaxID=3364676 RepID=UPI0036C26B25